MTALKEVPAAPPSPAGPVEPGAAARMPPGPRAPKLLQTLTFARDPLGSALGSMNRFGDVWQLALLSRADAFTVTCHPDHIKSVLTAKPDDAPSLTGESPLRPILGPNSVLTLNGERHMRQRKLLLPPFHGEAIANYMAMIEQVTAQELDSWAVGEPFSLARRMQAVTLEVIMRGVCGISAGDPRRSPGRRFRDTLRRFLRLSTYPVYQLAELQSVGQTEPRGLLKAMVRMVDRRAYAFIEARRAEGTDTGRGDVFSLLLQARDEEGRALTDEELRDELATLVIAGHETTANSLAWTFERLVRTPEAYGRLRELVRGRDQEAADAYVEATIHEGMRMRPVIPFVVRLARRPWRLGEYVVPAGTPVAMSIIGVQHRADVYPEPLRFRPERFLGEDGQFVKPGTYSWIPFGGGIRRCLGATLAMAEQRVVLKAIAQRFDLAAPDPEPERGRQRNVTMIPAKGGRVVVERRVG